MSNLLREFEAVRSFTPARLSLHRAGASPSTTERLALAADHALARDAVRRPLDVVALVQSLLIQDIPSTVVSSRATTLGQHLLRPDLGRRAELDSLEALNCQTEIAFVVADGLSSGAVEHYAPRMLGLLRPEHVVLVRHGRVAIGDEIGEKVGAKLAVVLIGERPGLSAPESLGIYITYGPQVGRTDAERYCISNIRDSGASPESAAETVQALIERSLREQRTGVQ